WASSVASLYSAGKEVFNLGPLSSALARAWIEQGVSAPPALDDAVEVALEAAVTAGRERWPELAVDEAAFVRHLAVSVAAGDPDPATALSRLCLADLYLACARPTPGARAA